MLAKIGDYLKPPSSARDQQGGRGRQHEGGAQGHDQQADTSEDVVFLSLSAIRALIREEASLEARAPELLRQLALLEQHGLQNLPVAPAQSVADAITGAASMLLSSSR
jgi:hypothetical protein